MVNKRRFVGMQDGVPQWVGPKGAVHYGFLRRRQLQTLPTPDDAHAVYSFAMGWEGDKFVVSYAPVSR